MTATPNLPAERKPQMLTGAPVAALVPQSLEEAFRLSGALAASGMTPRGLDKPEQIMVAIMAGAELGLAPFQSLQSFAVVNGRPTLWGDGLLAVVRGRGVKVKEWFDNDDEPTKAFCQITRPDTGEEVERTFSLADAKKANLLGKQGPWQTNQKRMLQMRARAFALRDGCADMLRGIQVREEVEDYQHVRVVGRESAGLRERLAGPSGEGFTSARAEDEPVDFADQAEEIADADLSPADESQVEPDVNDSAEAADTSPEPSWDTAAYAQGQRDNADRIDDEADLRTWWAQLGDDPDFKRLTADDEAEALLVKAHVVKRLKALKGGAA